jgi:hypothetical protein
MVTQVIIPGFSRILVVFSVSEKNGAAVKVR